VTATLGPDSGCGGPRNATADWTDLQSPLNPATGRYWPNLRCEWTLRAIGDPAFVLELRFRQLEAEPRNLLSLGGSGSLDLPQQSGKFFLFN
jgi:hypothetical protein